MHHFGSVQLGPCAAFVTVVLDGRARQGHKERGQSPGFQTSAMQTMHSHLGAAKIPNPSHRQTLGQPRPRCAHTPQPMHPLQPGSCPVRKLSVSTLPVPGICQALGLVGLQAGSWLLNLHRGEGLPLAGYRWPTAPAHSRLNSIFCSSPRALESSSCLRLHLRCI